MKTIAITIAALLLAGAAVAEPSPNPAPVQIRIDGLVADFFAPAAGGRAPGVLMLGGSEGGLNPAVAREAGILAKRGYAVLQLSYFGSPGQPAALKLIPLETFSRALDWMRRRPDIDPRRLGIIGTSKGAEAALLVAARHSDLKVVVVGVPSNVAWAGIDMTGMETQSSWTEGGRPVPFMAYGWTGRWKGVRALYEDGLAAGAATHRDAEIAVERIDGPVFMVCGEQDTVWPSCPMALAVQSRLRSSHFRYPVTLLAYASAGHAVFGAPVDKSNPHYSSLASLGGAADANESAREDDWPKALAALDAVLKP